MRGVLRNTKNGWSIRYFVPPSDNEFGWLNNDLGFEKVKLIGTDINKNLKDSTIVEFEIVEYVGEKYGKLIKEIKK